MKRILTVCIAVAALSTSASAWFGTEVFRDMKDSVVSISDSARDSAETISKDVADSYKETENTKDEMDDLRAAEYMDKIKKLETELEKLTKTNEQLVDELSEVKKKNEVLDITLKKSKSEKESYHQYVVILGSLSGLLLLAIFGLWFLNTRKNERLRQDTV